MRKRSMTIAMTTGLVAAGLVGTALSAVPATAAAPATAKIDWRSCGDTANPTLQCAKLEVPLDHARPNGRKIKIAINRLPATAPKGERQGPILLNPGGPGGSGLWMAPWVPAQLPADVAAAYDWIGFDLRGSHSSEPRMDCDPTYFEGPRPDYQPSAGTERAWLRKAAGYAADCAAKHADLLPHMKTVDIARDLDVLRSALGSKQVSFFGYSYGTTLGSTYGQLFPKRVKRMVLDSIVGPNITWYEQNVRQDLQHEKRFKAFTQWVAKADSVYHLGTSAKGVERKWYAMRGALAKKPVGNIGPSEWDDTQVGGGYNQARWPRLATALAAFTKDGDTRQLKEAYSRYAQVDPTDDTFDIYNAVQCTDSSWPRDWSFWRRDQAKVNAKAPFYTYNNQWYNTGCVFWPAKSGDRLRINGSKGMAPALLLQATEDAATVYKGGVEMARALPNARFVVEQGGGTHGISFKGNKCLDTIVADYLRNGKLPRNRGLVDVTCAKLPDPSPQWLNDVAKASAEKESPLDKIGRF